MKVICEGLATCGCAGSPRSISVVRHRRGKADTAIDVFDGEPLKLIAERQRNRMLAGRVEVLQIVQEKHNAIQLSGPDEPTPSILNRMPENRGSRGKK